MHQLEHPFECVPQILSETPLAVHSMLLSDKKGLTSRSQQSLKVPPFQPALRLSSQWQLCHHCPLGTFTPCLHSKALLCLHSVAT